LSKKRVLIGATSLVPGAALELLLTHESDLEVIGVQADDEFELLRAIEKYLPYGLILCESDLSKDGKILGHLLLGYPELRVILVGTDENLVHFYYRRDFKIVLASDLADVIRSS